MPSNVAFSSVYNICHQVDVDMTSDAPKTGCPFFCTCLDALGLRGLVLLVQAEVAELEHLLVRLPLEEEAQLLADRLHRLRKGD